MHNVQNAMFAAAMAFSLGIKLDAIRHGLRTFDTTFFQAPGRMNVFSEHPFKVIMDYAHNAHAVAVMADLAQRLDAGRRIVVVAGPGERMGLYVEALPLRLSLEPPQTPLWVDTTLTLVAGSATSGLQARITSAIKDVFDKAARRAAPETPAEIAAVAGVVPQSAIVRLRVTVTHDRDGLAEELDGDAGVARLGTREQPVQRNVTLRVESGDG